MRTVVLAIFEYTLPSNWLSTSQRIRRLAPLFLAALLLSACAPEIFSQVRGSTSPTLSATTLTPTVTKASTLTPTTEPTATATPSPTPISGGPTGEATFTGRVSDRGYDADGNGLFEHLQMDVEVNVTQPGLLAFDAHLLTADGQIVTIWGSLTPEIQLSVPLRHATLQAVGRQSISIYFNGQAIRRSEVDGPYTIHLTMWTTDDTRETAQTLDFTTASYYHHDFQGLLVEVLSISDTAIETDELPGYDLLRVKAKIEMAGAGSVEVQGALSAGETSLAYAYHTLKLDAGTQLLDLDFFAAEIAATGLGGPYQIYLSFTDLYYTTNAQHTSAAYRAADFQKMPVAFSFFWVRENFVDRDGNGYGEAFEVVTTVAALTPETYRLQGILEDRAGGLIASTVVPAPLDDTPTEITLGFDGDAIFRHGVDGPYNVRLALLDSSGGLLANEEYNTYDRQYQSFECRCASFNGHFADQGIDTNGDGLYDFLRIEVGLEVTWPGEYSVTAHLYDRGGKYITWAAERLSLITGTHTLALNFDGEVIRAFGSDGPYHLCALRLELAPGKALERIADAYETDAYPHANFQPSGQHGRRTDG